MNESKLVPKSELHNCKHEQLSSKGREVSHLGFVRGTCGKTGTTCQLDRQDLEAHSSLAIPSLLPDCLAKIDELCWEKFCRTFSSLLSCCSWFMFALNIWAQFKHKRSWRCAASVHLWAPTMTCSLSKTHRRLLMSHSACTSRDKLSDERWQLWTLKSFEAQS